MQQLGEVLIPAVPESCMASSCGLLMFLLSFSSLAVSSGQVKQSMHASSFLSLIIAEVGNFLENKIDLMVIYRESL